MKAEGLVDRRDAEESSDLAGGDEAEHGVGVELAEDVAEAAGEEDRQGVEIDAAGMEERAYGVAVRRKLEVQDVALRQQALIKADDLSAWIAFTATTRIR